MKYVSFILFVRIASFTSWLAGWLARICALTWFNQMVFYTLCNKFVGYESTVLQFCAHKHTQRTQRNLECILCLLCVDGILHAVRVYVLSRSYYIRTHNTQWQRQINFSTFSYRQKFWVYLCVSIRSAVVDLAVDNEDAATCDEIRLNREKQDRRNFLTTSTTFNCQHPTKPKLKHMTIMYGT